MDPVALHLVSAVELLCGIIVAPLWPTAEENLVLLCGFLLALVANICGQDNSCSVLFLYSRTQWSPCCRSCLDSDVMWTTL
jgi:hypothetical protein